MFLIVVMSLWAGSHAWIGWRLLARRGLSRRLQVWGWIAVAANFALPLLAFPLDGMAGQLWADVLLYAGYLNMGLFGTLFFTFLAKDVVWGVLWAADRLLGGPLPSDPARRSFLQNSVNATVVGASAVLTGVGFALSQRVAQVKTVEVPIEGLPAALDGFRIAQISDIHVGPTVREGQIQGIVDAVNALKPDLVAVTGDLVDGRVEHLAPLVAPLAKLSSRHGTFFVTGNHEYYSGAEPWCAHLADVVGMDVLIDAHRVLEHDGETVVVGGVADLGAESHVPGHRSDPVQAAQGMPDAAFRLLLAHQPQSILEAVDAGWDLQLSGHTHAGQFFPFTALIRLAQPWVEGLHRVERAWLYVNPGTTYWGPPIRLGAPQEITELVLRRA